MKDNGIVQGSAEQAKPLAVGLTTVYVHTDIQPVTTPDLMTGEIPEGLYQYHEVQYGKDEYLQYISEKFDAQITYISMMTDTLVEV